MTIQYLHRNQVTTPPTGFVFVFYDLDNGSVLTYKDSDCNFVSMDELPSVDTTKIDDCICEVINQIVDDAGCAMKSSLATPTEYESIINNINIYSVVTVDPSTGGYSHTVTSKPTLFAPLTTTNVLVNGDSTGTASVSISGGVGPYTQVWSDMSNVVVNPASLPAGAFKVTITDAVGTVKVITFIITEPPVLTLTVNVTNESAPAAADGVASAVVGGGVTPYTYVWNDYVGTPIGQTTQTATK
jgi:hypothetical protein